MATKKLNKIIPITLAPYHLKKLNAICNRTSLSKTGVVQRLIEKYELFELSQVEEPDEVSTSSGS